MHSKDYSIGIIATYIQLTKFFTIMIYTFTTITNQRKTEYLHTVFEISEISECLSFTHNKTRKVGLLNTMIVQ